jgi:hypothetical protein
MSLTAEEIASMQAAVGDWLPDTCTIQTVTTTVGPIGGVTESYANTYTGISCRLDPTSPSLETIQAFGIAQAATVVYVYLPYNQAIEATDRIVHDSNTYEVKGLISDSPSHNLSRQVVAAKVE